MHELESPYEWHPYASVARYTASSSLSKFGDV